MGNKQGRSSVFKCLSLSLFEVVWLFLSLFVLCLLSFYIAGVMTSPLAELPISKFIPQNADNLNIALYGLYLIAGLAGILLVVVLLLALRRRGLSIDDRVNSIDRSTELELQRSAEYLQNILDSSPYYICIKDTDLNYTFANKKWLEVNGLTLADVIGKNDLDVFGVSDSAQLKLIDERKALDGQQSVQKETEIKTRDEYITVLSDIIPLIDSSGHVVSICNWATDITGLKRIHEALDQARQEADSMNKAKSSFLATMSHEIRTPMNGVVGSLDLLRLSTLDDSQKQLLDTVNESAFSLLTIINDILDFSKIESGKLDFESVPVTLEKLLASVAASLIPNAQAKGIDLLISSDLDLPDVYADLVRLRQIVSNLASNAIKFTGGSNNEKGRVTIRCYKSLESSAKKAVINISVEDNGIGISEEAQGQLFQPFVQAEGSTTRRFGGSGLGLSITSRLVEMMGGVITIQSTLGLGTTFFVSIPFDPVPDNKEVSEIFDIAELPILFVRGEEAVNEVFLHHLNNAGVQCYQSSRNIDTWMNLPIKTTDKLIIIIVDCWANDLGVPALQKQLMDKYSAVDKLGFLILSQGYHLEPQYLSDNTIKLDYNGLGRKAFVQTINTLTRDPSIDLSTTAMSATLVAHSVSPNTSKPLLFAEDNVVNQRVIQQQLSVLGYSVEIAGDGEEALSLWEKNRTKYQLLLTDCHMPKLDGYGLSKAIRSQEKDGDHIPIIAITADAIQGADNQCFQAGMDDYLSKPLLIAELSAKLEKWLAVSVSSSFSPVDPTGENVNESRDEPRDRETEKAAGTIDNAIDAEILPIFLGSSNREMLKTFYYEYYKSALSIMDEIHFSVRENNFSELAALGHKLKSSSYTVGATKVGDTCLAIEVGVQEVENSADLAKKVGQLQIYFDEVELWIEEHYPSRRSANS
ncbi:MAG: ATP-binding protein [Porticoccus sp.]|nr:ATP-binding protein [Porticoccus sp.]